MSTKNKARRLDLQRALFEVVGTYLPAFRAMLGFVDAGAALGRGTAPLLRIYCDIGLIPIVQFARQIPAALGGFQTEIMPYHAPLRTACTPTNNPQQDAKRYGYLAGGMMVSNSKRDHAGYNDFGTIGCIAFYTDPTDSTKNGPVILGCEHVFNFGSPGVGEIISQPLGMNSLCRCNECAELLAFDATLDCAIARIDDRRAFRNIIVGIDEGIAGVAPVVDDTGSIDVAVTYGESVCKRGAMTIITSGTVSFVSNTTGNFKVTPTPGLSHFVKKGDSGAVVINSDRKVVGLLTGQEPAGTTVDAYGAVQDIESGIGIVTHIHPILDAMHITIEASTAEDINPDSGDASLASYTGRSRRPMRSQGQRRVHPQGRKPILQETLLQALKETPHGDELVAFIDGHGAEIQSLIEHERAVKLTWNRYKGTAFTGAIMAHDRRPQQQVVPISAEGVHRETLILQMAAVLQQYASPALRTAIFQNTWRLLEGMRHWEQDPSSALHSPTSSDSNHG